MWPHKHTLYECIHKIILWVIKINNSVFVSNLHITKYHWNSADIRCRKQSILIMWIMAKHIVQHMSTYPTVSLCSIPGMVYDSQSTANVMSIGQGHTS